MYNTYLSKDLGQNMSVLFINTALSSISLLCPTLSPEVDGDNIRNV